MGKHTDQRDRTLCLARILYEETDEKHPMPMTEMIRRLVINYDNFIFGIIHCL